jgi:murein DD-endopeptidase MepM/ murein hydrolase activator NlpD
MRIRKERRRFGSYFRSASARGIGRSVMILLLLLAVAGTLAAGFILFEFERPSLVVDRKIKFIGGAVELPFHAADRKSGISEISITLRQNGTVYPLFDRQFPRQSWFSQAGQAEVQETVAIDAKKSALKEGAAELVLTVRDFSLKRNTTEVRLPVTVDSSAPKVMIDHAPLQLIPGGSNIVLYTLSEACEKHGAMIGKHFFQGYPVAGKNNLFIAYLALPWNSSKLEETKVIAVDQAGNQGQVSFSAHFKPVQDKADRINISDGFLDKKIPEFQEYYPEMKGTNIEKYLFVNNKVRTSNAEKIAAACRDTVPEQLWHDRFLRMPGAKRAGYADQRTYYYKGQPIDHQTHLGIDLASTARAEVRAANRGRVIFAEYLGIYGNMVIIDHGQGLASLYSHLSRIETQVGKTVAKDEVIGRTGTSGMAGGDHLHFSMLVHGIFVTPKEWWDQHWIDVNINKVIR